MERTNARHLRAEHLPYRPELATVDVSFISLTKVLPAIASCLARVGRSSRWSSRSSSCDPSGSARCGARPGRPPRCGRGGGAAAREIGLGVLRLAPSGVPGPKGNLETFVHCAHDRAGIEDLVSAVEEVDV